MGGFGGGVFAVAGHIDDGEAGAILLQAGGEMLAAHAGHDHVGDEEIDFIFVTGGEAQGFLAVGGFDDGVAAGLEKFAGEFADVLLVFGEEDGFGAARRFG